MENNTDNINRLLPANDPDFRRLFTRLYHEYPGYMLQLVPCNHPETMPDSGEKVYGISLSLTVEKFEFRRNNVQHVRAFYGIGVFKTREEAEARLKKIKDAIK